MAGTGETPDTSSAGPWGYVGLSLTYNSDGELVTRVVRMFLSLDQAKQWARRMAETVGDDQIEETLKRLTGKAPFIPISIGADPEPPEEGNEEAGGTTQFEVVPGVPVMGELSTGGRRKRKTLRRRRVA